MKPKSWWEFSPDNACNRCRFEIMTRLKDNNRAFGRLSKAEQEVVRECEFVRPGCRNYYKDGTFYGPICAPCYKLLTGKDRP